MKRLILTLFIISFLSSCAHVVSEQVRARVDEDISPAMLFKNPDAYIGKTVILGGFIVDVKNTEEGAYIEVVQNPLDYRGKPSDRDTSYGRFIVFHKGLIDTAVYSKGRELTVAGEVMGKKVQSLGEIQYSYLLIKNIELHLISPSQGIPVHLGIGVWKSF